MFRQILNKNLNLSPKPEQSRQDIGRNYINSNKLNMNKYLTLVFLFLTGSMISQNYNFDLLTKYTTKVNGKSMDRVFYSSTKDPNIFLNVGGFSGSSDAFISDFKKGVHHQYKIKKSKENGEIFFTFKYLKTVKTQLPKFYFDYDFKFEEIETDTLFKKVKVTIFTDSSRNIAITTQTLTMKKSDNNLFPLYRVSCLHPFENLMQLNLPGNYLVISGTGITRGRFKIVTELTEYKPILLQLVVPE